jgi:hypothetical protein
MIEQIIAIETTASPQAEFPSNEAACVIGRAQRKMADSVVLTQSRDSNQMGTLFHGERKGSGEKWAQSRLDCLAILASCDVTGVHGLKQQGSSDVSKSVTNV